MAEIFPGVGIEIDPACVTDPDLQVLYAYWQGKRGVRPMPARTDLVVNEIRNQLGWVSLIDVLPDDFRYRLIGTRITFYFGQDTTGKTVSESFAAVPEAGAMFLALLRRVVEEKIVLRTFGDLSWMGREFEDFESLMLPFSDDGNAVNMIMNPFVFDQRRVRLNRTNRRML